jgi:hypothetical protein
MISAALALRASSSNNRHHGYGGHGQDYYDGNYAGGDGHSNAIFDLQSQQQYQQQQQQPNFNVFTSSNANANMAGISPVFGNNDNRNAMSASMQRQQLNSAGGNNDMILSSSMNSRMSTSRNNTGNGLSMNNTMNSMTPVAIATDGALSVYNGNASGNISSNVSGMMMGTGNNNGNVNVNYNSIGSGNMNNMDGMNDQQVPAFGSGTAIPSFGSASNESMMMLMMQAGSGMANNMNMNNRFFAGGATSAAGGGGAGVRSNNPDRSFVPSQNLQGLMQMQIMSPTSINNAGNRTDPRSLRRRSGDVFQHLSEELSIKPLVGSTSTPMPSVSSTAVNAAGDGMLGDDDPMMDMIDDEEVPLNYDDIFSEDEEE